MYKHIVMWKLKESAMGKSREENALMIKSELEKLPPLIPQISSYEVGINVSNSERSFDIALYSSFKAKDDFEAYRSHPEHTKVVEKIRSVSSQTYVVDYPSST